MVENAQIAILLTENCSAVSRVNRSGSLKRQPRIYAILTKHRIFRRIYKLNDTKSPSRSEQGFRIMRFVSDRNGVRVCVGVCVCVCPATKFTGKFVCYDILYVTRWKIEFIGSPVLFLPMCNRVLQIFRWLSKRCNNC